MSRQLDYQRRHKARGLCIICPEPAISQYYCLKHELVHRERIRAKAKCYPWRPGGPGRPPRESKGEE